MMVKYSVGAVLLILGLIFPIHAQTERTYRAVDPQDLVIMTVDSDGRRGLVAIELASWIAPRTVDQIRALARARFYDGLDFYRVIENFVAQGGDQASRRALPDGVGALTAELEVMTADLPEVFEAVQVDDFFASETAFIRGMPVARDDPDGPVWPVHCAGVVGLARGNDINSGTTEFYIPIGHGPRFLDRNLTIFGRVIDGFEHIQGVKRDSPDGDGIIDDPSGRTLILTVRIAADMTNPPVYEVEDTRSDAFLNAVDANKNRTSAFWHHKPYQIMDVCTVVPKIRIQPQGQAK